MANSFELKAILSAVDKLSPVLKGVQGVAKQTRKYLGDIGSAAGNMASKIGLPIAALSGIAGGGLLLAAKKAVTDFAQSGAALDDMAKRTGLTTDQLQLLAYQGEMADVSIEALQGAVGKLQRNMGDALAGKNKELAGLFKYLGVSMRGADGRARSVVELLPELADKFKETSSQVKRARMGMALFGKSYADVLPLLVDGRTGLEEAREEWERIGFNIPADQIASAAALDDSFVKLRYATDGLFKVVGARLAPVLQPVIDRFIEWAAANRDVLASKLNAFVDELVGSLSAVDFDKFVKDVEALVAQIREFVAMVGGAKTILIAFGVLLAAGPLVSVLQFAGAVGKLGWFVGSLLFKAVTAVLPMLGAFASVITSVVIFAVQLLGGVLLGVFNLLMANPIVLVIAGIAAAAYLIIKNWDTVKAWFTKFFDWIGEKWKAFTGWVNDLADAVGGFFGGGSVQSAAQGGGGASLAAAGQQRMTGSMAIEFRNAPAGMRVTDASSSPGFDLGAKVGYNGFALDTR